MLRTLLLLINFLLEPLENIVNAEDNYNILVKSTISFFSQCEIDWMDDDLMLLDNITVDGC